MGESDQGTSAQLDSKYSIIAISHISLDQISFQKAPPNSA